MRLLGAVVAFYLALFLNPPEAAAGLLCADYFSRSFHTPKPAKTYRPHPESFSPNIFKQKVSGEEIRRFQSDEGSFSFFAKYPDKNIRMAHALAIDNILHATLGFTLNDIHGIQGPIDFFKSQDKKTLSNALRGDWGAKQNLFQLLRMVSSWINEAHPQSPPTDLTRRDDFSEWLGFAEKKSASLRWDELLKNYQKYMHSTETVQNHNLDETAKRTDALIRNVSELIGYPNDIKMLRSHIGLATFISRKSTNEMLELMEDWTQKMHLSAKAEEAAFADLRIISQNSLVNARSNADNLLLLHASLIRYFTHYVLPQRFPDFLNREEKLIAYYDEFARVQNLLQKFDAFYKRQEIHLEETLLNTEGLNRRIDNLLTEAEAALSVAAIQQKIPSETVEALRKYSKKILDLKIDDLNPTLLSERTIEFERLQFHFEKNLQEIYRQKQKQEIHSIAELGAQWDLLLPQKRYLLKGLDFDSVSFSHEVVEYFQKNLDRGSYFLTALSKGYVGHRNSSGLREIPAIHPDFRDIKLIKHGGKVRIVGRIIEKTIHFFLIYNEDQPYDNGEMRRTIQRFQPDSPLN